MSTKILPIQLGFDQCYVVQGTGLIMIDAGAPGQAQAFVKALNKLSIDPREIRLIVITHAHWDHVGSAREIREITGAKVALHQQDRDYLQKSTEPPMHGATTWGRILAAMLNALEPLMHLPAVDVDLVLDNEELPLADYGIPGKVIYTPGHTMGSVSVVLESGEAFVGDLAMNRFPLRLSPGLTIFAEDPTKVQESWKLLLKAGARMIYPAHGKPFPVDIIQKALRDKTPEPI